MINVFITTPRRFLEAWLTPTATQAPPPIRRLRHQNLLKADLPRDVLHHGVVRQDVRDETAKLFFPTDLDEQAQQLCAKTVALPLVADYDRPFRFVQPVQFA